MIRKTTFENGLTLLTESMPDVRSVCLGVWLRRGSRDEPAAINGISHFIEHLVFKGTDSRSARDIALEMDAIGGQMDAFTSKEYTCFYAKVLDEHLDGAVELLADVVQNPAFDPRELERERLVVLEEIRMVEDTPDELLFDLFSERVYPAHPLGRPIQGTEKTVSAMSRRRLLGFFHQAYCPSNMLIVAAGSLRHARLSRLVGQAFAGLRRNGRRKPGSAKPVFRSALALRDKPELEQLHLLLGLPAFPTTLAQRYALHVLNTILGGTMSSRLFQRIREERGLAYSVYSALNLFSDSGVLALYAGTSPPRGDEAIVVIRDELRALADAGPTEDEIHVAREHLKGSLMLSLESTSSRMSNLARQEIYFGRELGLAETLAGIERVDAGQIKRMARRLFRGRRIGLAAVGRVGALRVRARDLVV
ncbi:MAG TPA: pitrilysin family protein [Candidatus Polarisedimenticolaceae bacterium]|nr:pitrilysin family protein [Candidatus Polarisedimenticolaceae bacterium]